ncbi:MAG: DMT family transporter [Chromatiales bacterium]|jgi:drug/metabolite transporter (DMT)-like permease
MSVPAAYLGVILIWSTTPLAIKWSGEGVGYLFGVTGRMLIGVVLAMLVLRLMRLRLSWGVTARQTYLAAGLGIYLAMTAIYWSAQLIPSGWVAVVFGLAPIVTGVMARLWLTERGLTPVRLAAILVALTGLGVIFTSGLHAGGQMVLGLAGVLFSVLCHSASAVWIKRLNAGLHGLVVAAGGLLVATPLFLLTWLLQDGDLPTVTLVQTRTLWAIVYLGVIGSVLGFALYYYVLRHVETTRVALITLVTPVIALIIGQWLNGESVPLEVWLGTSLILLGLLIFELGSLVWQSNIQMIGRGWYRK